MLKISKLNGNTKPTMLRLDGSLSGVWVEELRRLSSAELLAERALVIDCGGLLFSDAQGIELLRDLRSQEIALTNCSPFLQFQLQQTTSGAE